MVLLSLAASLSVYLCVVTMLDSQAARTIVSNFMDSDLTGWNGSIVERIKGSRIIVIEPHFYERDMSTLDLELS